jgi:hypothetical protein
MIKILGDVHLSDEREWSYEVSYNIVKYIINDKDNIKDNILILEGDITEKAFISGRIIRLVHELFSGLKYKLVLLQVGNHDLKLDKNGNISLIYEYIKTDINLQNITIIENPTIFNYDNKYKILLLPHILADGIKSLKDYEHLSSEFSNNNYTLICGHFNDTSIPIPAECIDISYLKTKYVVLGHYHNPNNNYIGSIVPNSTKEAGYDRRYAVLEKDILTYIPIPKLLEYHSVNYPEPLIKDAVTNVYTIYNCIDKSIARQLYGNIYIKDCISTPNTIINTISTNTDISLSETLSYSDLFSLFTKDPLSNKYSELILNKAKQYLK